MPADGPPSLGDTAPPPPSDLDCEMTVMRACAVSLEAVTAPTRRRIVAWLVSKYGTEEE